MFKRLVKLGVVLVVVAMFASSGWSQQRQEQRGFGFMRLEETGKYISIVLLLNEETSAKVQAVYQEEGPKLAEKMREMRQSAGEDREAMRAKFQEEREKSAERIKEGLKGILSEAQISDIEPLLTRSSVRRDAHLWALASLKLNPDQRARMLGVTVPYATRTRSPGRRPQEGQAADRTERQERMRRQTAAFQESVADILTPDQKKQWEDEAATLQEQWEKERQERGQRMGQRERGGRQRQRQ